MEFRILGPLEVLKDGVPLHLSAPREQAVLAVLMLEANRVVPISRLIEAIWDGVPPETARNQVQMCVSTLRRVFGPQSSRHVIRTRSPGYQLDVTGQTVDAIQFEALIAAGREAADDGRLGESVRHLRAALGLWRGWAAAGVDSRLVQIAATRLNEQRLAAVEVCIGLELRMGNHAEVIGELASLVAEYPLREKLRAHQMLALYRAGRRAEALAVYREARQLFIEELGLDPGQELRQLERAILENDPDLDRDLSGDIGRASPGGVAHHARLRAHVPRQLPADIADFTGREQLVKQLCGTLAPPGTAADPARAVVLHGMKGVGKTTLAVHVAHLLEDYFPDGQLFVPLGGEREPASVEQVAERCLRAIGVGPGPVAGRPGELADMFRSQFVARHVLFVFDDAASASQVTALLPGGQKCAAIVTSRRRLPGLPGGHSFEVGLLPPASAVELLSRVLGEAKHELGALAELCGFWPPALRIVAARLLEYQRSTLRQMATSLEEEPNRISEPDWASHVDLPKLDLPVLVSGDAGPACPAPRAPSGQPGMIGRR
jgi:DNA-binding SARP family transcriptional activator